MRKKNLCGICRQIMSTTEVYTPCLVGTHQHQTDRYTKTHTTKKTTITNTMAVNSDECLALRRVLAWSVVGEHPSPAYANCHATMAKATESAVSSGLSKSASKKSCRWPALSDGRAAVSIRRPCPFQRIRIPRGCCKCKLFRLLLTGQQKVRMNL